MYTDKTIYGGEIIDGIGQPAKITHVALTTGRNDGIELQIWVAVRCQMLSDASIEKGAEPIDSPDVMMSFKVDEMAAVSSSADLEGNTKARMFVEQITRILKEPFKVDENTLERFADGGDLAAKLIGKSVYVKAAEGQTPGVFYFNPKFYVVKEKPMSKADLLKRLKAKREQ